MKKLLVSLVIATSLLITPGCSSSWWTNITNDPGAAVDDFITQVNTYLPAATVVFDVVVSALPVADQAPARAAFAKAVALVEHTVQILHDAVQAARDAKQPIVNVQALINDVVDAVQQVVAVIDSFSIKSTLGRPGMEPLPGYADIIAARNGIWKYKH